MDIKTIKTLEDGMAGIKTEGVITYVKKAREIQGPRGIFYTQWLLLKDSTDTIPLTVSFGSQKEEIPNSIKNSEVTIDKSSLRKYLKKDGSQGIELKTSISNIIIKQKQNDSTRSSTNKEYTNDRAIERPYIAAQVALKSVTELVIGDKIPLSEIETWTEKLYNLIEKLGKDTNQIVKQENNKNENEKMPNNEMEDETRNEMLNSNNKPITKQDDDNEEITEEQINTIIDYTDKIPNDVFEKLLREVGVTAVDEIQTSSKANQFIELCKKEIR